MTDDGCRAAQVDPCVAENQPARFLDDEERWFWRVYPLYYTNWNKRRYDGTHFAALDIWRDGAWPDGALGSGDQELPNNAIVISRGIAYLPIRPLKRPASNASRRLYFNR